MNIEHKGFMLEIKSVNDDGTFEGVASPYGNIDLGGDRVLKSCGKRNVGKKNVPYCWQHDTKSPIGAVDFYESNSGIEVKGKLILDTLENGMPKIPKAHEAHALMKAGLLSNSIGYITIKASYTNENGSTVRNLEDIDILELSAVTFPMNPLAKITNVKEASTTMDQKALSFTETLNIQNAQEMRWKLMDALNASFRGLIEDQVMTEEEKIAQLTQNVSDFSKAYLENMSTLLKAAGKNSTAKKSVLDNLEQKQAENVDSKAENTDNGTQEEKPKGTEAETQEEKQTEIELEAKMADILKNLRGENTK